VLFNPQTLNRYTYVTNNPLKYTDPTGHFFFAPLLGFVAARVGTGMLSGVINMATNALMTGKTDNKSMWASFGEGFVEGAILGNPAGAVRQLGKATVKEVVATISEKAAIGAGAGVLGGTTKQIIEGDSFSINQVMQEGLTLSVASPLGELPLRPLQKTWEYYIEDLLPFAGKKAIQLTCPQP
jgi:hypothetical protein